MTVILVCLALGGFALLYTLVVPQDEIVVPAPPTVLDHLIEKKKTIYDNLKDVNFEYRTGKLADADYQQIKLGLQYELAVVMREIEEQQRVPGPAAGVPGPKTKGQSPKPTAGQAVERAKTADAAAARVGAPDSSPARAAADRITCVACGYANPPDHVHCSECGAKLPASCAACGHANPPEHKHCSRCGAKLVMLLACALLGLLAAPRAFAAHSVTPTVINLTTGKPLAGQTVNLSAAGQRGMQSLGSCTTGGNGACAAFHDVPDDPQTMVLLETEYQGVRYTQPVQGDAADLKVYDANAPASAVHVGERDVILMPRSGRLQVNELYTVNNDSSPPATYNASSTFRFAVPKGGEGSVQAAYGATGGVSLPLTATPDPKRPGVFQLSHAMKPGENRIEISYELPYPGSMVFEATAPDKIDRTRIAVAQGVQVEGQGVSFAGTEPQMKFGIYNVAANGNAWQVKISGEGAPPSAAANQGQGEAGDNADAVLNVPGWVGEHRFPVLASVAGILLAGFLYLWSRSQPRQTWTSAPPPPERNG